MSLFSRHLMVKVWGWQTERKKKEKKEKKKEREYVYSVVIFEAFDREG